MNLRGSVYKCGSCGSMAELLKDSENHLQCCGKDMNQLRENTTDASQEKHIPIIETSDKGITVKVGSVLHPMESDHYIEWVELIAGQKRYKAFLNPTSKPEAFFPVQEKNVTAREYCNKHGLWKS